MRTRKEIVEEAKRMIGQEGINLTSKLILETLLDIRDLLQPEIVNVSNHISHRCSCGSGLCPFNTN